MIFDHVFDLLMTRAAIAAGFASFGDRRAGRRAARDALAYLALRNGFADANEHSTY